MPGAGRPHGRTMMVMSEPLEGALNLRPYAGPSQTQPFMLERGCVRDQVVRG